MKTMKVSNRKCIRRLSYKTLWASRTRNVIAVIAITLTALLFTSLFTVILSINASNETYTFRQIGGYSHGAFKEVSEEQIAAISAHPAIKETGERLVIGYSTTGIFAKVPAEISYMDSNNTKWSYCTPHTGRMPEKDNEISMDTKSLQLLGIKPELGAEIVITYDMGDQRQKSVPQTDTFTLVGYWEYDELSPVHFLNVSKDYARQIREEMIEEGLETFRTDLNIMLESSFNIRGVMEQVDTDLGYQWENRDEENCVRIGVNWGYTSSQMFSNMDTQMVLAIIAFMALVIFTGYLIIYNIFQISVTGDIRFYGLIKTIGVTPAQLRRIIRQQALFLCCVGIPLGLLGGYGVGALLTPFVLKRSTLGAASSTISTSPMIFIGSAVFSLVTVIISCTRPGRMAAKVSPVEATKYTEVTHIKKKKRATRGARVYQMAFANLGRSISKTILVVLSLSLSVVLLTILYTFISGFDMDKYMNKKTSADFIVGTTGYFRYAGSSEETGLAHSVIEEIRQNTRQTVQGAGYFLSGYSPQVWISEEVWKKQISFYVAEENLAQALEQKPHKNGLVSSSLLLEGLDDELFDKLTIVEGNLAPLFEKDSNSIAICVEVDDYGNIYDLEYPKVGDTISVTYIEEIQYIDSRTGKPCNEDTPEEYLKEEIIKSRDVEYKVCALVKRPYTMGPRFSVATGYQGVLPAAKLSDDSVIEPHVLFYMLDTPDDEAEAEAERFLRELTQGDLSGIMYESKETVRKEFESFRNMFLMLGGLLCLIVGFVGILNFFNAIMTSILSRRREFAVLESIGMTRRQLKKMLAYEGLFYALSAVVFSLVLVLVAGPIMGNTVEKLFWFFTFRFTLAPVLYIAPLFAVLGVLIPLLLYHSGGKASVVERLRETE